MGFDGMRAGGGAALPMARKALPLAPRLFVRLIASLIPSVAAPERRLGLRDRMGWILSAMFVYLLCSQIPLFGVLRSTSNGDALYWIRLILASHKGTLFELGLAPLMTAQMVLQVLRSVGALDQFVAAAAAAAAAGSEGGAARKGAAGAEKWVLQQLQKFFGIGLTLLQASAYVLLGYYGPVRELGAVRGILIVLQLCASAVILVLLEDALLNGYGIGDGGLNIFVALNVCERLFWRALSPLMFTTVVATVADPATGEPQPVLESHFQGAIVAFFHLLFTRRNKFAAVFEAFTRSNGTNLLNLLVIVPLFLAIVYAQGFRVDLPIKSSRVRGPVGTYPIKLFYTSSTPVILLTALTANIYFFSEMLSSKFPRSFLVTLIGRWKSEEAAGGGLTPTAGLAYYLSAPPRGLIGVLRDPFHALIYVAFILSACAMFGRAWVSASDQSPEHIAAMLRAHGVAFKGYRDSNMAHVLNRYIPAAAAFGGACVGALMIMADMLGVPDSGTGVLLAVSIIYSYWEALEREKSGLAK